MCKNGCCSNVEEDYLSLPDYKDIESCNESDINKWDKTSACSKTIFPHESWQDWSYEDDGCALLIYPSFTEIKNGSHKIELPPEPIIPPEYGRVKRNRRAYRRWQISQDLIFMMKLRRQTRLPKRSKSSLKWDYRFKI